MKPCLRFSWQCLWITLLAVCLGIPAQRVLHGEEPTISFKRDVAPIFLKNCVACHDARKAEGGYRIDTFAELSKPGDSGIEPLKGNADEDAELLFSSWGELLG